MLNNDDMFGSIEGNNDGLEFELNEVFGSEVNNANPSNTISRSNSSYDNIVDEDDPIALGSQILFQQEQRKKYWRRTNLLLVGLSVGYL